MPSGVDRKIIEILKSRDSRWTLVRLRSGDELRVFNIAWGYDLGDEWAHVTTNISPEQDSETPIEFFYTSDVEALIDEGSTRVIWEARAETRKETR